MIDVDNELPGGETEVQCTEEFLAEHGVEQPSRRMQHEVSCRTGEPLVFETVVHDGLDARAVLDDARDRLERITGTTEVGSEDAWRDIDYDDVDRELSEQIEQRVEIDGEPMSDPGSVFAIGTLVEIWEQLIAHAIAVYTEMPAVGPPTDVVEQ